MQLPQSQATNSEVFSEDGSVSRDVLQRYLTPGAVDGFLGPGDDDNSASGFGGEDMGLFNIPQELLVTMPIAEVTPGTKIIHLGQHTQEKSDVNVPPEQIAKPPVSIPTYPQAGPFNVVNNNTQEEPMDTENAATGSRTITAATPATITRDVMSQPDKENSERRTRPRPPTAAQKRFGYQESYDKTHRGCLSR